MICSACGKECSGIYDDGVIVSNCCGADIINNPPTGGSGVPHKEFSGDAFQGCFHNYPTAGSVTGYPKSEMSLRDYFAAKAMQGLLSNFDLGKDIMLNGKTVSVPQLAYMYADSMLKAREEK